MRERFFSVLWLVALAIITYSATQQGVGSPYLYTVVAVIAANEIINIIWPNWIIRASLKHLPALTGLFSGLWFGWAAWTILTPTVGLGWKVFGIGLSSGLIIYHISKAFKESRERRITVELTR